MNRMNIMNICRVVCTTFIDFTSAKKIIVWRGGFSSPNVVTTKYNYLFLRIWVASCYIRVCRTCLNGRKEKSVIDNGCNTCHLHILLRICETNANTMKLCIRLTMYDLADLYNTRNTYDLRK